ncbi:MAG TPA: hypothetical protein VL022_05040 [Moheibacter sp.]|nr:hypothetical protein [Moheibacter sp.]
MCKAIVGLILWTTTFSFGQLYVSDSATLVIEKDAFISEIVKKNNSKKIYVTQGTITKNLSSEDGLVFIASNKVQKTIYQKVTSANKNQAEVLVRKDQVENSIIVKERFARIAKKNDRNFLTENLKQLIAIVQVNSHSKDKDSIDSYNQFCIHFYISATKKPTETQDSKKINKGVYSLFSLRGPPF